MFFVEHFYTNRVSTNTEFSHLSPIPYKNRVRVGIGREIGQTEVERAENSTTRAWEGATRARPRARTDAHEGGKTRAEVLPRDTR